MLTPEEHQLLRFEETHPGIGDKKTGLIYRAGLGYGTDYWQRIHQLAHRPDAIAAYPMVCGRVQRLEQAAGERREERARLRRAVHG